MNIPQIEPITRLSRDHRAVLKRLETGPVFLAQRSSPAAVLLSVGDYEKMVKRLQKLELLVEAENIAKRIDNGEEQTTSHDELVRLVQAKQAANVGNRV